MKIDLLTCANIHLQTHKKKSDTSFQNGSPSTGFSQRSPEDRTQLTILHVNDTHRKIWPLAKIKTAFSHISSTVEGDVVKALAGDFTISNNKKLMDIDIDTLNKTGFDIVTLGNHEFDAGIDALAKAVEKSNFYYVDANLDVSKCDPLKQLYQKGKVKPATILNINNHRYGFIGVSPPNLMENMSRKNDLSSVTVYDVDKTIESIRQQVNKLHENGINKVILVSHAGYKVDKEIASKVDGLDVIVGGHSHTELSTIETGKTVFHSPSGKPVLVLQAGHDGTYFGVSQFIFNQQGEIIKASTKLENVDKYPDDHQVVNFIRSKLKDGYTVTTNKHFIANDHSEKVEHPVCNLVTDAIKYTTEAQVGMLLGGNIRDHLRPGKITDIDIDQLLPFDDKILKIQVSGQYLLDVLKAGADSIKKGTYSPGLIQVSGIRYKMDGSKNIKDVVMEDSSGKLTPLKVDGQYTLAVNEYFIDFMERKCKLPKPDKILAKYNVNEADSLKYYFHKNPTVTITPHVKNRAIQES